MKACTKCGIEKAKAEFNKASRIKGGVRYKCKSCEREYRQENSEKIAERKREYSKANAESISKQRCEYRKANHEKIAERGREYYRSNIEKILEHRREYRKGNAETIAERKREYYKANPEKFAENHRKYSKANPEKIAANCRNRRARCRAAEGANTASDIRSIFEKQRGLCANCQIKLSKSGRQRYHVDHIMPLKLGGSNWPTNLQCLCPSCNLSKGAKHPDEWAAQNGRLI